MTANFKEISPCHWRLPKADQRLVDIDLFLSKKLSKNLSADRSLEQLIDASELRGVLSPVVGLPDIH